MYITNYGPHPPINLPTSELRKVIIKKFGPKTTSFQFQSFCDYNVFHYLKSKGIGLTVSQNTIYKGGLDKGDCVRIRQIIWDLIIERYLTIGSYDNDSWPYFTVTERGHIYFDEYNTNS
ncbi:hypothetical protein [Pedobacter aquatilis]|uniref:hypothetical protein n=1 Tax=Pedobacter aquatilis TaxID=351343 RepID=UPI00292D88A9|nr:hypothetical protein [Pedobacter aquatilis]